MRPAMQVCQPQMLRLSKPRCLLRNVKNSRDRTALDLAVTGEYGLELSAPVHTLAVTQGWCRSGRNDGDAQQYGLNLCCLSPQKVRRDVQSMSLR